jgi:glycosyltransferase involved in cell wall biosynthesis
MFSVVIPTCNRPDLLKKCLDSLHPSVQKVQVDYEIIVSDDSHDDKTKLLIEKEYDWVKWVNGPRKGPAANRNNGSEYSKYDWLIFIDDDVMALPNLLEYYYHAIIENIEFLAFEGAIEPDNWNLLKKELTECPVNIHGGCFWTANVCIQKNLFNKIGRFDENYKIAAQEDQDIFIRIKTETTVCFIKHATVVHPVRKVALLTKLKKSKLTYENYSYFIKKHEKLSPYELLKKNTLGHLKLAIKNLTIFRLRTFIYHLYYSLYITPKFYFSQDKK